ncbi:MAG: hypothetical protein R3F50_00830 [Gammaproteobacteria bacterium]|jgi:hypothetical protein
MANQVQTLLTGLLFSFVFSSNVPAVPLTGSGDFARLGTSVAERPELAGTIIEDLSVDFSFTGTEGQSLTG